MYITDTRVSTNLIPFRIFLSIAVTNHAEDAFVIDMAGQPCDLPGRCFFA